MDFLNIRWKRVSDIQGLENYKDYIVDIDGNVWSLKSPGKIKKLNPVWAREKDKYFYVALYHKCKCKRVYVHRLVALAFSKVDDVSRRVSHKEGNSNNIENLEWLLNRECVVTKKERKQIESTFDKTLIEKCKKIHSLSLRKGMSLPNEDEFIISLLENGLEEHINKFGLRKILHQEGL